MAVKVLRKWSRAEATRRATRAWDLRAMGHSWDDVAQCCGYASASTACRAVRTWREGLPPVDVQRMRDEAVARCEWLIRQAAIDVLEDRPGCITAMVRAESRLSELCGLDVPQRAEVVHTSGLEQFWATLYAGDRGARVELGPVVDAEVVEELDE